MRSTTVKPKSGLTHARALNHQHLYSLMFNHPDVVEPSEESLVNAVQSFEALVTIVADCMARNQLAPADSVEVAQAIWSAVHGAMS